MRGEVHIWKAWISDAEPYADRLIATLSSDEKARGMQLIDPDHSQRFLLAQAIFRDVVSRYINQSSEAIAFERGQHGKPYLAGFDLQFNLTHSNECVLVALAFEDEVGIDVEYLKSQHRFDDLVKRFFSHEEQQEYLLYTSDDERRLAFYRGWTRKEAYLKAIGLGLSYPLHKFTVSLAPNEMQALLRVENDETVRTKWTVLSFDVDKNYLASLAIKAPVDNLQTHQWSFSSSS